MKIVNVMNFVRRIDERAENSTEKLLNFTKEQLRLVNSCGVDNTFLLQYDAVCDEDFVSLFRREATGRTELGLWYEIVEPLTSACGMPYRSENGWKWDWHIIPGYSMAYTPSEREQLIDEAMQKFRQVFGYYPKTVGGWVIDTHTLNYLAAHYDISAAAICRDQANTDAYTLLGGYFNGAYYPSKNNIFTPAQTEDMQTNIPVFRLLGPCPIHNYDNHKYSSDALVQAWNNSNCFTLEPCWYMGSSEEAVKWMFDTYYGAESLGFAYTQIGQENSFFYAAEQVFAGMRMQIEMLRRRPDVQFRKMRDTGALFRARFPALTPPTSVAALDNFDTADVQSVYYDCKNYTANLFRFEDKIFFRSLFLFDERVADLYLKDTCTTFDAIYENLPVADTRTCSEADKKCCGMMFAGAVGSLTAERTAEGVLTVRFGGDRVTFFEDRIETVTDRIVLYANSVRAHVVVCGDTLCFTYKGHAYSLTVRGAVLSEDSGNIEIRSAGDRIELLIGTQKPLPQSREN